MVRTIRDFTVAGYVGGIPLSQVRVAYTKATSNGDGFLAETPWMMNPFEYKVVSGGLIYPNGVKVNFTISSTDGVTSYRQANYGPDRILRNTDGTMNTLWKGDGTSVVFSGNRASQIRDKHGLAITLTYGPDGLERATDASGRYISYQYYTAPGGARKLRRATGSDGQWAEYTWADASRLTHVAYNDGTQATYTYTLPSGPVVLPDTFRDTRAEAKMQAVKYTFIGKAAGNANSRFVLALSTEADPDSGALVSRRDSDYFEPTYPSTLVPLSETRGDGAYRELTFKGSQVTKIVGYEWEETTFTYSGTSSLLLSIKDPRGHVTSFVNEAVTGKPTRLTHPDGTYREVSFSIHHILIL
jgi:hypothetical protein